MNSERIFKVILQPRVSEKSTLLADQENQMIFDVALDANKLEIKKAVEALFSVKVESVRTSVLKGKSKRFGRFEGKRSDVKKAYVKLAEGSEIDFVDSGNLEG